MTIAFETTANAVWTATSDWGNVPDHITCWIGTDFLGEATITEPEQAEQNDTYTIGTGMRIPFTVTPARGTAGQADAALSAALGTGNLAIALHDGDPGDAHTANELTSGSNAGYARVTVAYRIVTI